ncbi:MAG TPA: pre-peptidase C-terminal domain-containing protein, partial [Thermoanaerobaculia bacterium]
AAGLPDAFALEPRIPADKRSHPRLQEATELQRLVIKFHEGTAVRLRGGLLAAQGRDERDRRDLEAHGLSPSAVDGDVAEVRRLVALAPMALDTRGIERLFALDEDALAERRARGEARRGRQLADLDLYYELRLKPGVTAGEVADLLDALNALHSVEIAYAEPPAHPASLDGAEPPAPTPDFQSMQGYLNPAPQGVDALYAWTLAGGAGQGVKIVDIEGGWRTTHEDLPPLFHTGGTQIASSVWINHGTAVLGELVGKDNGLGAKGIVHQAQAGYESIGSQSLPSALVNAGNAAGSGVVLIELHYSGPTSSSPCTCNQGQCYFVPAEYFQAHYDTIADLTANGTTVVEAAGNGSTNLDDPVYGGIFQRNVRDSGAILVAASNSFDRSATCWTNWGSRIDVHGWGNSVTTLGYGDLFSEGGEDRWYTGFFGGTSSASPIVTGAAASLHGRSLALFSSALDPITLRDLLTDTGTPHTGTKNIGPLPDLKAAFDALVGNPPPPCYALTRTHSGSGADPGAAPGNGPGCPAGQYRPGTAISLTASPAAGWQVAGWSGTSDDAGTSNLNSLTMPAAPHTVSVAYAAIPDVALSNGVPRTDSFTADASQTAWRYYYVDLEPESSDLAVDLFGLTGDVDLYVRQGAKPTLAAWDCRPFYDGLASEHCAFASPAEGRWWIGVVNFPAGTFTYSVEAAWTSTPPVPLDFYSVAPCRAVDTRPGPPLASGIPRTFPIAGTCDVPASARAVAVNVTAVSPSGLGYVAVWPANLAQPLASVVSFPAGWTRASNAILRLATDGTGNLAAQSSVAGGGTVHLVVDVTGYFDE